MALVRCEGHGKPKGSTRNYVAGVEPVGYPDTAAICGRANCESPGLGWLDTHEHEAYQEGQRIFEMSTATVKIRAA